MANPIAIIKEHKFLALGGVVAVIGLVWLMNSGGSGAVSSSGGSSDDALSLAQLQLQSDQQKTQAAADAHASDNATSLSIAQLEADTQNNAYSIQGNISMANIAATLQALTTQDTLQAQVANNQTEAQTKQLAITTKGQTDIISTLAGVLESQQQTQLAALQSVESFQGSQKKSCPWYNPWC